jgi:CdiI N-terminal domain
MILANPKRVLAYTKGGSVGMFRIRIVTPAVMSDAGHPHAGGEFALGADRLLFLADLRYWGVADYQLQWQSALERLAYGAPATALFTAYRGPAESSHVAWALWREDDWVYVQEQMFLSTELGPSFDPWSPDAHVGARVPASAEGLPIAEWRTELVHLLATAFRINPPRYPF